MTTKAILISLLLSMTLIHHPCSAKALRKETTPRKDVFEFKQRPSIRQDGDRVTISFEARDYCDVTVAVEHANGRIVRHLAAGVLGANAPEPLQKNALRQVVVWDGKDDFGRYIDDKASHRIRVSLGLKAEYEKDLYYHPKRQLGFGQAVAIDKDGVYVYENNVVDFIKMYDRDAKYVRTVYPFPANKIKRVKGLKTADNPRVGKTLPVKQGQYIATLLPIKQGLYDPTPSCGDMAVHKGHIALLGKPRLARIKTDGSTGGLDLVGPKTWISIGKNKGQAHSAAFSPDGKWIYMARVVWQHKGFRGYIYNNPVSAIYRMPFNGVQEPKVLIGDQSTGKMVGRGYSNHKPNANDHFNIASSVDTDARGRIYVSDYEHNRIQIFSAEGKYLKTIPVVGPGQVMVHKKTGAIYVATWHIVRKGNYQREGDVPYNKYMKKYNNDRKPMLRKFASFEKPRLELEAPIDAHMHGLSPRVALDSWASAPTFWVVQTRGPKLSAGRNGIKVFTEKDGRLFLKNSFDEECKETGMRQLVPSFQRQFLYYDSLREHLYVGEPDSGEAKIHQTVVRIDVNTGKTRTVGLPAGAADAGFDALGMAYLRVGDAICRYNPEKWREIPYDYGNERSVSSHPGSRSGRVVSGISTPGAGGSSAKYGSFGVSPDGNAIASCCYSAKRGRRKSQGVSYKRWTPRTYPGRPSSMFVHVFDRYGNVKHEDVMKGIGTITGGLDMDFQGNLYGTVRSGGKGMPAHTGVLVKFKAGEGRFLTDHNPMTALSQPISRPRDIGQKWVEKAEWFYAGGSVGSTDHCWCRHGKFKVDYYGRSFIPEYTNYSVAVLDTNGNPICRIGQYGNVDSAGPKSLVPLPGDGIGLVDAHYVNTHTDKRLFIADVGNGRIVSARLDYHVTERLALKGQTNSHALNLEGR